MQQMNQETKDSDMQIEGVVECLLSRGMRNVRMRFKTVVSTTKIVVTGTPAYGRSWIWIPWNERPCVLIKSNICGLWTYHFSTPLVRMEFLCLACSQEIPDVIK